MRYSEIEAYTGYGKICQNIYINSDFNDHYSKNHKWSDVPFASAKRIMFETPAGKFIKKLPIAGMDHERMDAMILLHKFRHPNAQLPTSANWFQIYHALNDLVKESGCHDYRLVDGLEVTDNGETLQFAMGR